MTNKEFVSKFMVTHTDKYDLQLLADGLHGNITGAYDKLIKDAARCNRYCSDIIYEIDRIRDWMKNFNPNEESQPMLIGFRKDGVDSTAFVVDRTGNDSYKCYREYFALYSVDIEKTEYQGFYNLVLTEYAV